MEGNPFDRHTIGELSEKLEIVYRSIILNSHMCYWYYASWQFMLFWVRPCGEVTVWWLIMRNEYICVAFGYVHVQRCWVSRWQEEVWNWNRFRLHQELRNFSQSMGSSAGWRIEDSHRWYKWCWWKLNFMINHKTWSASGMSTTSEQCLLTRQIRNHHGALCATQSDCIHIIASMNNELN